MKLKLPPCPFIPDIEVRYLVHCSNVARILASVGDISLATRLQKYFDITGAELVEKAVKECSGEKKLCPRCRAVIEFAQDPLRICDNCGWRGNYTKLEEV